MEDNIASGQTDQYFITIADDTGVLRLMQLPKHLWAQSDQAVSEISNVDMHMGIAL